MTEGVSPMKNAEAANVEDLVRLLVKRSSARDEQAVGCAQEPDAEQIVFDADVDGVRYLLVRLPKSTLNHPQLSPREHEIVRMVALGHSNKIIADVLNISAWTVCTHLRRIFAKLGVGTRAAMIARVSKIGRPHVLPVVGEGIRPRADNASRPGYGAPRNISSQAVPSSRLFASDAARQPASSVPQRSMATRRG
jgi:DNA-binding CsgD family transcriptional regulator